MYGLFYLYLNKICELKFLLTTAIFFISALILNAQDASNITLLDQWNNESLMASVFGKRYSDCWGYVMNGQEYAIIGSTEGYHFFKISQEGKLIELDTISGNFQSSTVVHRDIKTYDHYAYLVCDEGPSTMKIVDLSYLPDSVVLVNSGFTSRAHNIFIDSINERLYLCGATHDDFTPAPATSLEVYSLADPENPILMNYWTDVDIPYVHDCYVRDNIAILNCGTDGIQVYDFSDAGNEILKSSLSLYLDQGYNHQGWLSPDGLHYFFADETQGMRIKKCSFSNNQVSVQSLFGTNVQDNSVPHNMMVNDQFIFVAYYNEGFRIYKYGDNGVKEIAHYDTYPDVGPGTMDGAWGVYSELPSGRILVSDRVHGLFLFEFNQVLLSIESENDVTIFPNPATANENISLMINSDIQVTDIFAKMFDINGNKVGEWNTQNKNYLLMDITLRSGEYRVEITYTDKSNQEFVVKKGIIIGD